MATNQFLFDGRQYRLQSCSISAVLPDPYWCDRYNDGEGKLLLWFISFEAADLDDTGEWPTPSVTMDGLSIVVPSWTDLTGTSVKWSKRINSKTKEPYGSTYSYEHEDITSGSLEIVRRRLTSFRVRASGVNAHRQRFEIEASVPFEGIEARGAGTDTALTVTQRLSKVLDVTALSPGRYRRTGEYGDGTKTGSLYFKPKV